MPTIAQLRAARAAIKIDWTAQTLRDISTARTAAAAAAQLDRAIAAAVTAEQKARKP